MSTSSTKQSSTSAPFNWKLITATSAAIAAGATLCYKLYQKRQQNKQIEADMSKFPVIDLSKFLEKKETNKAEWEADCKEIARLLKEYGMLIVQDPRVDDSENEKFLDMMERYYDQEEKLRTPDARPELHYQVGVTPENIEHARNHCSKIEKLDSNERPFTACPPEVDLKSRFFWRMGERPPTTEFESLNAEPVIPKSFPTWSDDMNRWGSLILGTVDTVASMAAIGFDLPENTFTSMMKYGPHLLAPTGSNLGRHNAVGTVFAAYHYDLNFLTIHGRSRFPGLFVWTRGGRKMQVRVPPKCLLLQAGKQFEWLTGGEVLAGFHEVVVVDDTIKALERAKQANKSTWRISSTLFGHIASDQTLQPLGHFATKQAMEKYPAIKTGLQVKQELEAIALASK